LLRHNSKVKIFLAKNIATRRISNVLPFLRAEGFVA